MLDNPNGFMMVGWKNRLGPVMPVMLPLTVRDVMSFDSAIMEALKFYALHPNDSVVVTGDHETGGMTVGFAGTKYTTAFSKIGNQKLSFEEFDKAIKNYRETVGSTGATLEDWLLLTRQNFGSHRVQ